jgi:transposase
LLSKGENLRRGRRRNNWRKSFFRRETFIPRNVGEIIDENFNEIIRFTALLRALKNLNALPETEAQELKQVRKALEDYISFIRNNWQVP